VEERVDAELELGRHSTLVGELEALATQHPLRERLHARLMLALYRSGRQAEALAAYHRARRGLVDELGIEPSAELQRLEQAILRHDDSLDPLEPGEQSPPAAAPTPARKTVSVLIADLRGGDGTGDRDPAGLASR